MAYLDIAKYYDQIFLFSQAKINFLNRYLPQTGQVLDFGCGTGKMTDILNSPQRPVLGIDIDATMISEAKRLRPETNFLQINMNEVEFERVNPTAAFCIGNTLSYLPNELLIKFLTKLYKALPENGIWIFQTLNWDFVLNQKERYQFHDLEIQDQKELSIFQRWYDHITPHQLKFHRQVTQNGKLISDETDTLFPQTSKQYDNIHHDIGFKQIGSFANFKGDLLDTSKDSALIKVFKK
jgi:SAM-dependent methyltransferase